MSLEGIEFYKVSGGGNDFVAVIETSHQPTPAEIQAVCQRRLSVGADGLFLLDRQDDGVVHMRYFNADGTSAALCLNGTRCAARLAFEVGWSKDQVTLLTGAGLIRGENAEALGAEKERIRLHLQAPEAKIEPVDVIVEVAGKALSLNGWRTVVGVPHLVFPWGEALSEISQEAAIEVAVEILGAALVHHAVAGPEGANVNLVSQISTEPLEPESQRTGSFAIRTYERGVNAETLACGTGVMASALCLRQAGHGTFPVDAYTAGGFTFTVDAAQAGEDIAGWSLTGDARIVSQGRLLSGALV